MFGFHFSAAFRHCAAWGRPERLHAERHRAAPQQFLEKTIMEKEELLKEILLYKDERGAKSLLTDVLEPALAGIREEEMILSLTVREQSGVIYARTMDGEDAGIVLSDNVGSAFAAALEYIVSTYYRSCIPGGMIKHKIERAIDSILCALENGEEPRLPKITIYGDGLIDDRQDDDHQSN